MKSLLAFLLCGSAHAAGSVYAVLPTQGVGATTEATLVSQVMRLALQEQSLALVPAAQTESAAATHAVACGQSLIACGRLVGQSTSATHVIVSELWDQAGALELKVALVDVRIDAQPAWQTHRAPTAEALGPIAKRAVLALVAPDALAGLLSVKGDRDLAVLVDGVEKDKTPLVAPVRLAAGQREVELRATGATPLRTMITIESQRTTTLTACVKDGAVVKDACGGGTGDGEAGLPIITIAGGATAGVGVLVGGVAAIFGVVAMTAFDAATGENGDDPQKATNAVSARGTAIATGVVAAALVVVGGGALGVGLAVE